MSNMSNSLPEESILGLTEAWVPSRQTHFPITSVYDDGWSGLAQRAKHNCAACTEAFEGKQLFTRTTGAIPVEGCLDFGGGLGSPLSFELSSKFDLLFAQALRFSDYWLVVLLGSLGSAAPASEHQRKEWTLVKQMATRSRDEVHLCLQFVGDFGDWGSLAINRHLTYPPHAGIPAARRGIDCQFYLREFDQ